MNETNSFSPSSVKRSWSAAVWTASEAGRAERSAARTESSPATSTSSYLPCFWNIACAAGRSISTNVAVPIESTSPNVAMPVTRSWRSGPRPWTVISSPRP